jgi:hypothetical protein
MTALEVRFGLCYGTTDYVCMCVVARELLKRHNIWRTAQVTDLVQLAQSA